MALETSRFHWFWLSQVFATLDSLFGLNFDRFLEFGAWWSLHGSIWLETREMFLWSRLAGEMWFYHCWFDENTKRCATLTGCDVKLCWRWLCRSRCLAWWNGRNGHFQSFQIRLLRCFRFRCPTWWRMVETYLQQSEATTSDELFFLMFGMGYEGVHLYKGYFKDTVPAFYHKRKGTSFKIAVLRLDCQFHWCLSRLFVLFLWICTCWWLRHFWWLFAWLEFKTDFEITEEIISIDGVAAYFKKMKEVKVDFSKMRAPRDANIEWKKWTPGRQVFF